MTNYQRQSSGGTTIETINGKHYVNGVEVNTGRLKISYYIALLFISILSFITGYFSHYVI